MSDDRIAIVTDSTADIPVDITERYHISVIPNTIIIDGNILLDGQGISREDFYQRLPSMKTPPTTATASSGDYERLYDDLLKQGFRSILSIHASSMLSGIYNAASIAAQTFSERVHVFDSEQITMGLGFQVIAAAEAAINGAMLINILGLLSRIRPRARVIAMLDSLEYVRRSGRVSWARARLGEMLSIKPFIEMKAGQVLSLGEARTYRKGLLRLMELLTGLGSLERIAILHTNAEEEARRFLEGITFPLPNEPLIVNVTTVIGSHIGPHSLGIAAITRS